MFFWAQEKAPFGRYTDGGGYGKIWLGARRRKGACAGRKRGAGNPLQGAYKYRQTYIGEKEPWNNGDRRK